MARLHRSERYTVHTEWLASASLCLFSLLFFFVRNTIGVFAQGAVWHLASICMHLHQHQRRHQHCGGVDL